jgi:hypothetical protein
VREKHVDMTERLQRIGQTVNEYNDTITSHFRDMNVEVKDWHFTVGKLEKEYAVEVNFKLCIKPKKAKLPRCD